MSDPDSVSMRRRAERVADAETEMIRQIEATGAIRHLHGTRLQHDEDSEWHGARILKEQGFSHPTLERAREIDDQRRAVEAPIDRLRRRYEWLSRPGTRPTREEVDGFNLSRAQKFAAYEVALGTLNRAIRDYNLGVHPGLQRPPIRVDELVARIACEIPALPAPAPAGTGSGRHWLRRFRR